MGQAWEPGSGFLLAAQSNGLPRMLWLWCRGMLSFELRATCCDNEPGSTRAHSATVLRKLKSWLLREVALQQPLLLLVVLP